MTRTVGEELQRKINKYKHKVHNASTLREKAIYENKLGGYKDRYKKQFGGAGEPTPQSTNNVSSMFPTGSITPNVNRKAAYEQVVGDIDNQIKDIQNRITNLANPDNSGIVQDVTNRFNNIQQLIYQLTKIAQDNYNVARKYREGIDSIQVPDAAASSGQKIQLPELNEISINSDSFDFLGKYRNDLNLNIVPGAAPASVASAQSQSQSQAPEPEDDSTVAAVENEE